MGLRREEAELEAGGKEPGGGVGGWSKEGGVGVDDRREVGLGRWGGGRRDSELGKEREAGLGRWGGEGGIRGCIRRRRRGWG